MASIKELESTATQVRRDILRMVHAVNSGHPGGSLGCTDFMVGLYYNILNANAQNFTLDGKDQDMFFLSNGHISPLWYSVLARKDYFPIEELASFRKLNTRLQGHPTPYEGLPGIRIASGSLGQGLSVAIGAAEVKKMNKESNLVYTLMGDGELQEGQVWEALMYAGSKKVDNLIATIDYNNKQIDGSVDDVMSLGNLQAKLEAFGWQVVLMDGNNMTNVIETLLKAKTYTRNEKPISIIMTTEMGQGVDFMMGTHDWHGKAPNDELLKRALDQLPETIGDY